MNIRYRTHNKKTSEEIVDDIAKFVSEKTADFIIDLRNELEAETPKDTEHGAINWLIRKRAGTKEYGKRSPFPAPINKRNYNQPNLSPVETGEMIAVDFDIRDGNGNLTVFNNVDYVAEINSGTHPAQQPNWSKNGASSLIADIGFIEKTISKVEGKHGF